MIRFLGLLRSLGNAGAVANARSPATARRREDWVVAALERRVNRTPALTVQHQARRTA